jgi:AcrR family transcriptional regulator
MPKIVDHDKYRQEMLEKCFYFFGRNGYSNITMEDIADEIGVSKGTLYHYFPSKENMLRELISWAGIKNVSEYERRTSSIDSIDDRVDQIVFVLKESGEFYRNIMLLAVDMYRNTDIEQVKELYVFFSENFIGMISGRLNVSRELADSIFIHVIGVIFNSLALDKISEYDKKVDALSSILKPMIVDAPDDTEKAVQKFKEITNTVLMNKFIPAKTVAVKKNKTSKIKKAITERKDRSLRKQLKNK